MAKSVADAVLDAALNQIKNNVTQECVCNAQPTDYTTATSTYKLAIKTGMSGSSFTGPADGDTNGRKVTVNQQAAITVDTTGTATYIALCTASVLYYVTTCTSQVLTQGNTVTIPAWDIEIADPS
jgi:hypothetical protein